jgi:hypothetical protein
MIHVIPSFFGFELIDEDEFLPPRLVSPLWRFPMPAAVPISCVLKSDPPLVI